VNFGKDTLLLNSILKLGTIQLKVQNGFSPNDVKQTYVSTIILKDSRIVFNIKGNSYRLIVKFNCEKQWAFIRFIGTHAEYDKIDADTI